MAAWRGRLPALAPSALPAWLPAALSYAVPFAVVFGTLLYRNAFLFSTPLYEDADMGANSILIEQARRFTLLVGHYSREGFNHPGPAFLYVQAWGEQLLWAALRVVPTAWNGQLIAVYALNSVFAALIVVIVYRWTRSLGAAAAGLATLLALAAVRPEVASSGWMPYVLVPAFLTFLVASASVAAGRVADSWVAALAGWFLINGDVAFLFFVPLLAAAVAAAAAWRHRDQLRPRVLPGALRALAAHRAAWLPAALISAAFAFPIAAFTVLHWPGEFGKYLSYSTSPHAGGHSLSQLADYLFWFWWPHRLSWLAPPLCYLAAAAATRWLAAGQVRRLALSLLAFAALSNAAFVFYAAVGIDEVNQAGHFIGYFSWSVPAVLVLVVALSVADALARGPGGARTASVLTTAAAVLAGAALVAAPLTRTSTERLDPLYVTIGNPAKSGVVTDPGLPAAVTGLARLSHGRPVVLQLDHDAWPALTGLLVQAERAGVAACVANPGWAVMVTSQFICTPAQRAAGRDFWIHVPGTVAPGTPVLLRLRRGIVTAGTK